MSRDITLLSSSSEPAPSFAFGARPSSSDLRRRAFSRVTRFTLRYVPLFDYISAHGYFYDSENLFQLSDLGGREPIRIYTGAKFLSSPPPLRPQRRKSVRRELRKILNHKSFLLSFLFYFIFFFFLTVAPLTLTHAENAANSHPG